MTRKKVRYLVLDQSPIDMHDSRAYGLIKICSHKEEVRCLRLDQFRGSLCFSLWRSLQRPPCQERVQRLRERYRSRAGRLLPASALPGAMEDSASKGKTTRLPSTVCRWWIGDQQGKCQWRGIQFNRRRNVRGK